MSDSKKEFTSIEVKKINGEHIYQQGIKGGRSGSDFDGSAYHNYNGYGGDSMIIPMQLNLKYKDNAGQVGTVSIKQEFKEEFPRITEKRLEAIKATIPNKITLENNNGKECVSFEIMNKWKKDAKDFLKK